MFAFVIEDRKTGRVLAGRDHMGKIPCYIAYGKDGSVWFSSEMKTLVDDPGIAKYEIFPPGHYYIREKGESRGQDGPMVRPRVGDRHRVHPDPQG